MINTKFFLFVAILSILQLIATANITADEFYSCKYTSKGHSLDLNSFKGKVIEGDVQSTQRRYFLSLCHNLEDPCGHLESALCSKPPTGSFGVSHASNSATKTPAPSVEYFKSGDVRGFKLSYANSDPICDDNGESIQYKVDMNLVCSEQSDENFVVDANKPCELAFSLKDPLFCGKSTGSGGLSGGAILLIILFSITAAYFIIGFIICKVKFKKPGCVEAIPQHTFWCALPGLFIAGVKCTFGCFARTCCGKKGSSSSSSSSGEYESYGTVDEI